MDCRITAKTRERKKIATGEIGRKNNIMVGLT